MTKIRVLWGRGPSVAFFLMLSLVLAGCGGAAPAATPNSGTEAQAKPQASAGPAGTAEKPVSQPPIVVPAPGLDPARRDELAALIEKSTKQPSRTIGLHIACSG